MGKASRDKGARGEREAAKVLRECGLFPNAARAYHQSRSGDDAADLENTGPFWFEVKRGKGSIRAAHAQADSAAPNGMYPVAMTRVDRGPWLITMTPEDLVLFAEFVELNGWANHEG